MTLKEIRNSKEYIDAFANYIKTGDDKECRALLTEIANNDGTGVPVPELVEDRVRAAWNKNGIMSRVRKSYIKGVLKVGFEASATGADYHTEGAEEAPGEETLVLGITTLVPGSIKKWITISDEAMDLSSEAFLDYIYDEITYQIAKCAADNLIAGITAAATTNSTTHVGVAEVQVSSIAIDSIAQAISLLSDSATDPVVVINKGSYGTFKALQYATGYGADPFEGLPVEYSAESTLVAAPSASPGDCVAIVGDFGNGAQANFPNGDEIKITYDNISQANSDMVRITGREYVGLGLVADKAFCRVVPE